MKKPQKTQETESDWKKIGPCLYRDRGAKYYALLKHGGKQIRRTLDTTDLPLARRRLAELRRDLETTDPTLSARTLEAQVKRFQATLTGAASTRDNHERTLRKLLADWPKDAPRILRKITKTDCQQWLAQFDLAVNRKGKWTRWWRSLRKPVVGAVSGCNPRIEPGGVDVTDKAGSPPAEHPILQTHEIAVI